MNTHTKSRSSRSSNRRSSSHKGGKFSPRSHSRGRKRGNNRRKGGRKMPTFNPSQFINKNPIQAEQETYTPQHTFATIGMSEDIVASLAKEGITSPTPIQDQIIPAALAGRDVIGLAETGTGKTAAFLLPLIEQTRNVKNKKTTLVLAPTRELAIQIKDELRKFSHGVRIFSTICVGGMPIRPQIRSLEKPNQFVIGTPGRIMDLMDRGVLKLENVSAVVLDEADRMLDMGFIHDMKKILSAVPSDRQTLFFSATMAGNAESLVHDFLNDPVRVSVKKKDVSQSIEQDIVPYEGHHKFKELCSVLGNDDCSRVIIFGEMKHSVQKLSEELSRNGIPSEAIHGNKSHAQRQRALRRLKEGDVRVLVATDVAARGIHVDDVSHVINYDLPQTFDDYVHRIGRTGRGDKFGKALTFVPASSLAQK